MRTVTLPKDDRQIATIVKDPEAYVRETRKIRRRKAAEQRAVVLKASKGRVRLVIKHR